METQGVEGHTKGSTLFLAALLLSASEWGVRIGGQKLLFAIPPADISNPSFLLGQFLISELAPFLVSPVALLFVFYELGKRVPLSEEYLRVAGLLFMGGVIGSGTTFFLLPLALGEPWGSAFPNLMSVFTTALGALLMFL